MKCLNCNAEWTVPQNISHSLSNCPFCGASLKPTAPRSLSTVEDVLQEILQRFGMDILKNGQKLIAIFSDLSPQLKRERLLLTYLIQADGNNKLLEARGLAKDEQQACFQQVCKYLVEEQFVAEEAARRICTSYSMAIGLNIANERSASIAGTGSTGGTTATTNNSRRPSVPPKPPISTPRNTQSKPLPPKSVAQSTTANRIDTFAKYQKALEDYYILQGKKPLTYFQIQQFISTNALGSWGITISDVQKDLKDIYAKYTPASSRGAAPRTATAPVQLVFSPNKRITTYKGYMDELEQLYIQNGKQKLSTEQIVSFLRAYGLQRNFGIKMSEVEKDQSDIAKKYSYEEN